jgi:hypothetical protein
MSHDGAFVFFESPIALTPHALNDIPLAGATGEGRLAENVYEWHEGEVHLISDGKDAAAAGSFSAVHLIGADASGENVLFTTTDQLVAADTDTQVDVYDARVCRADSPCVSEPAAALPPCTGEACHGIPPEAPHAPGGGSAAFSGPGNLSAGVATKPIAKQPTRAQLRAAALARCHRLRRKPKREACEKAARRRYPQHRPAVRKRKRS